MVYLHFIWPSVLALVPTHYGASGQPNHFVDREVLWNVVWFPAISFIVLTFLPQVHAGESLFWSSFQQRRTRLVVVLGLVLATTSFVKRGAQASRNSLQLPLVAPIR